MRLEVALSEAHFVDRVKAATFDEGVVRSHWVTRWRPLISRAGLAFPQKRRLQ
jgi:hypothetical protein